MFRKGKFATLFEILPDLILKALYKENKNKKVKVKSPDTAEKDETTQTSNTCNSKTFDRSTTFVKESCLGRPRFLSYAFSTIFSHCAVSARSLMRCPG